MLHGLLKAAAQESGSSSSFVAVDRDALGSSGRTPLALRLAIGVLEQAGGSIQPRDWERITAQSPELVQAAVYDRLLRRLKDPWLKRLPAY